MVNKSFALTISLSFKFNDEKLFELMLRLWYSQFHFPNTGFLLMSLILINIFLLTRKTNESLIS